MAGHQHAGQAGGTYQLPAATAGPGRPGPRYGVGGAGFLSTWRDGRSGEKRGPEAPWLATPGATLGLAMWLPLVAMAWLPTAVLSLPVWWTYTVPTEDFSPRAGLPCRGTTGKIFKIRVLGALLLGCRVAEVWPSRGGPSVSLGEGLSPTAPAMGVCPLTQVNSWPSF